MHACKPVAALALGAALWIAGRPQRRRPRPCEAAGGGAGGVDQRTTIGELLRCYTSSFGKVSFFLYAVMLGIGMTIVENLLFLYFRQLHASYFVCGLSVLVTVMFEIPLFACSKKLLDIFGARGCLVITGLCYSFRVVGYTLVPNGAWLLFFEPMHGVTYAFWQTASVEVMASITPPELMATGMSFLGGLRNFLGVTCGNLLGGWVIDRFGEATLYRLTAILVGLGLATYAAATSRRTARGASASSRALVANAC